MKNLFIKYVYGEKPEFFESEESVENFSQSEEVDIVEFNPFDFVLELGNEDMSLGQAKSMLKDMPETFVKAIKDFMKGNYEESLFKGALNNGIEQLRSIGL